MSIEDVLTAHKSIDLHHGYYACSCGRILGQVGVTAGPDVGDRHRTHVADAIRAHLAEHTDEAAGAVERVRALADEMTQDDCECERHWARRLRAALAGGASGATEGAGE